MDVEIAASATAHGITVDDMLHGYRNVIFEVEIDEGFTMLIGAARTGALLEIGVVSRRGRTTIIHAMRARQKYLRGRS